MLTPEQAGALADTFTDAQLARATARYDKLLRRGLDLDAAFITSIEWEIVRLARRLAHEPFMRRMTVQLRDRRRP